MNSTLRNHLAVYESDDSQRLSRTPIDEPVVGPSAYRDALALIVPRMRTLADRLETDLRAIGGGDFGTTNHAPTRDGTHSVTFYAMAWLTRQTSRLLAGMVGPDELSAARATLAGAVTPRSRPRTARGSG